MQPPHPHEDALIVSKRTMEIVVALVLLALAALVIKASVALGHGWVEGVGPGSGFFPFIVASMLAVASLYNLGSAIFKQVEDGENDFVTLAGFKRILFLLVPLILFVAAIHYVGIYVASALFIAGFMLAFGQNGIMKSLAVGIAVPLALFLLFEKWFLVPLPKGPVEAMLGY